MLSSKKQGYIVADTKASQAYDRLLSHAKIGIGSGDYKKDLMKMLADKYEKNVAFDDLLNLCKSVPERDYEKLTESREERFVNVNLD